MAKTGETILILGVVVIGGIIAIKVIPQLIPRAQSFIQGTMQHIIPASPGKQATIQGPTGVFGLTPAGKKVFGNNPPTVTGGTQLGAGGSGKGSVTLKPVLSATKCPNGKSWALCPNCKSLCNSPGTFDACCRAKTGLARRSSQSYMRWSYNAVRDRIIVV